MSRRGNGRVGVWIVGARGAVAVCSMVGAAAIRAGCESTTGMVSALGDFAALDLADPGAFVFGGHDLRTQPLVDAAADFRDRTGVMRDETLKRVRRDLRAHDARIRPGVSLSDRPRRNGVARTANHAIERIVADIDAFRSEARLDRVVVVHLASTEAPASDDAYAFDGRALTRAFDRKRPVGLTDSMLYAAAAAKLGVPFVNFTPSPAFDVPALADRADAAGICYAGNDGKTGETLLKTVLAPMFVARNLRVLTWHGYNMLGNADGASLADPARREAKLRSKDASLARIVGGDVQSKVSIDYVPSLDDWKTAWDFIHFEGFLGAKMALQFTWQGCDSALAAPLVLDLVRFVDFAARRGETGALTHLASFFKNPLGVDEPEFHRQVDRLADYARAHAKARA